MSFARKHTTDSNIYILSAKYGFINSSQIIDDYNLRIDEKGAVSIQKIKQQVQELGLENQPIVALCSGVYLEKLRAVFKNVEAPIDGLPIGYAMQKLKNLSENERVEKMSQPSIEKLKQQIKGIAVEIRKVEQLLPYARNSRTHSDYQINQIASSIKEFGFTNPILITKEGEIIAGHGRVLAAMRLNMDEVPCITLGHLTDIQRRAYVIADNQLALNAGWDYEMLQTELDFLNESEFDVSVLGMADFNFETDIGKGIDDIEENLDGIDGRITVKCSSEMYAEIKQVIEDALEDYEGVKIA